MKKYFLILLLFYLFFQNSNSQQFEWVRNYPMQGRAVSIDSSGNIYVVGSIGNNFHIIKYGASGNIIWLKDTTISFGGYGVYAATDRNRNLYFTLETGDHDYQLFKYDSSGSIKWSRIYNGGSFDRPQEITLDTSGNIIITGISQNQAYNYLTIKYNPQGDSLWTARYRGMNPAVFSVPYSVCTDKGRNVFVTGLASDNTSNGNQWATIKYNSFGIQQWVRTWYGPYGQFGHPAYCVKTDNQGNAYVAGDARITFSGTGFGAIKYNSNGDSLWTRIYTEGFDANNYAYDLEIDDLGNVYVFGHGHESSVNPYGSYTVVKYNSYGNLIWVTNDTLGSTPSKIILRNNKYVYITGGKGIKMYTVGYDSSGSKIFTSTYPTFLNTQRYYTGQKVFFDKNNGMYIFGSCVDTLVLMKYSLPTNIRSISENVSEKYELFQNYPNPFNPATNIKYQISNGFRTGAFRNDRLNVTLKIYNILGKEIETLVNEKQAPDIYEVSFDGTNYPSSVYFYKLIVGDYTETKRMVLIK